MSGLDSLVELLEEYDECGKCPALYESRLQVVFGSGSASADIMIVGESPGAIEDTDGSPFMGDAGQLLMDLLATAWPQTDELTNIRSVEDDEIFFEQLREYLDQYIFWTNVVLCRPEDDRTPSTVEVKTCRDRLHQTIYAVDPLLIITTGKVAATALVGRSVQITAKQGSIMDITVTSPVTGQDIRYPVMSILSPAYLLRRGDQKLVKRKQGDTYNTIQQLKYAILLLTKQYSDQGHSFPDRSRK